MTNYERHFGSPELVAIAITAIAQNIMSKHGCSLEFPALCCTPAKLNNAMEVLAWLQEECDE